MASQAFSSTLLRADALCMHGHVAEALKLYKQLARHNRIAARRIAIAQRQIISSSLASYAIGEQTLRIGFVDWYGGFEQELCQVLEHFSAIGYNALHTEPQDSDILVVGCYGNTLLQNRSLAHDKLVILLTGENISPAYDIHDFSITTRRHTYCGKNIRLPQWHSELTLAGDTIQLRPNYRNGMYQHLRRDYLISAVYNNSTPEREEILHELRQLVGHANVHVFGSQRTGQCDKTEILARSVINVCFENSIGDGYITEKLFQAKAMGCKALYWGDSSFSQDFLADGVFNVYGAQSKDQVLTWCREQLLVSTTAIIQPTIPTLDIFTRPPSLVQLRSSLKRWCAIVTAWRQSEVISRSVSAHDH